MTATAKPQQSALLVGVSEYPSLGKRQQLKGPKNDILLMRDLLISRGFQKDSIRLLADGIPEAELPTRAAILDTLKEMADTSSDGDFVYLHFSGHGSQMPTSDKSETDHKDEIFLPRDVGPWNDSVAQVENAITDNELGQAIGAIRAKGAFVWAVFDACHSATLTRGVSDLDLRYRGVEAEDLGIPDTIAAIDATDDQALTKQTPAGSGEQELPGGYIAFYAAQTTEWAPEMRLPRGQRDRRSQGVFSFNLAQVLSDPRPMTYRQVGSQILYQYAAQGIMQVTPMFEGSHLDAPVFGSKTGKQIRQWPVINSGQLHKVAAGHLQQLGKESVLLLVPEPAAGADEALGYARAKNTTLGESELEPFAYAGKPAIKKIPEGAYAQLIVPHTNLNLQVALPSDSNELSLNEKETLKWIKEWSTKPSAKDAQKGPDISWTKPETDADIHLLLQQEQLWLAPSTGQIVPDGSSKTPSIRLTGNYQELQEKLAGSLNRIGRATNLLRLAGNLSYGGISSHLSMTASHTPKQGAEKTLSPEQSAHFQPGDALRVSLKNAGDKPLDVTLLYVDSRYGIQLLYPQPGQINRLQPGSELPNVIQGNIDDSTLGTERLIAIAVEAEAGTMHTSFGFLAQASLSRTREGGPADRELGGIKDMMRRAGFGQAATRGFSQTKPAEEKTTVQVLSWTVDPK